VEIREPGSFLLIRGNARSSPGLGEGGGVVEGVEAVLHKVGVGYEGGTGASRTWKGWEWWSIGNDERGGRRF